MQRRSGQVLLGLSFGMCLWLGLGSAALACDLLPATALQAAVEGITGLEERYQGASRCSYSWQKNDWQNIETENQQRIREAMQRGHNGSYERLSAWATVSAELVLSAETEEQAQSRFQAYLGGQAPEHYGSPEPLYRAKWKVVDWAAGQAAWSASSQQLLLLHQRKLVLLGVQIEAETEKNQALALQLAAGVHF